MSLPPYTSVPETSSSINGNTVIVGSNIVYNSATGSSVEITPGSESLIQKLAFWHANDMQYYIKNTGSDSLSVKINVQLTPDGDEIEVLAPTTLAAGESLIFYYDKPAYYIKIYVNPNSLSSTFKDEFIIRWKG